MRALRSSILLNTCSRLAQQSSKKNINISSYKLSGGLYGIFNPSRVMNLHTLKLSNTFSTTSSQSSSTKGSFDMMWQQAYNKLKDVDSKEIFEQFKEEVTSLKNHEAVLNYCLFILDIMKQRMEVDKALEVCDIAVKFCLENNQNKEPLLVMFKGQRALFLYKLGKKEEANQAAQEQELQFDVVEEKLNEEDKIGAVKLLQEVFQTTEDYVRAQKYAEKYCKLIEADPIKSKEPFYLCQVYSSLFDCAYGLNDITQALSQGLKAVEQIDKLKQKNVTMHYLLIGVSFCYAQLGNPKESEVYLDKAIEILKVIPNKKDFGDLEAKKKEYQGIREKIVKMYQAAMESNAATEGQSNSSQAQNGNDKSATTGNDDSIWNEEDDHGMELKNMKDYKEALEFYTQKLTQLSPNSVDKRISIHDRIGLVYYEMGDFKNAVNSSLKAHEILLEKQPNKQIFPDKAMFQNLSNIKVFYYQNRQYAESVEWGKKWQKVCESIGAFNTYNSVVEEYMIQQVLALKELNQLSDSIAYCKLLETYVLKFFKNDPSYIFSVRKLQYELNYYNKDLPGALASAMDAYKYLGELLKQDDEAMKNNSTQTAEQKQQSQKMKEESYMLLKNITALALQVQDEKRIIQYGQEYLKKQEIFEGKNAYTRERQLIEMSLGRLTSMSGDLQTAEVYLRKAVTTASQIKVDKLELGALISLASVLIRLGNLQEALSFAKQAHEIDLKQTKQNKNPEISLSIARVFIFGYQLQKEYGKCLEWIDQSLQLQVESKMVSKEQHIEATTQLLRQMKELITETKDKEQLLVIANKHDIKNL